ncbi:hypothetical protein GCM10010182_82150 [Actinomadura cremea]|nr:hypothetical protein GCM10010182_82150 [Actinomadura cremea]
MSTLIEKRHSNILIEYRQFCLREITQITPLSSTSPWFNFGDNQLYFKSARSDHYATVELEYYDATPDPTSFRKWEETAILNFFIPVEALEVWTITMGPSDLEIGLRSTGWHQMNAYCAGREELVQQMQRRGLSHWPESIERYLLQFWPIG